MPVKLPSPVEIKEVVPKIQNIIDTGTAFGTGSYKGSDLGKTLIGNGYVHSMVPASLVGAGTGALLSALTGGSILSGAGLGLGLGAGLGALHQKLYDSNKDYAFNNPFTKFVEWMAVPRDKDGIVNVYDRIKDSLLKYKPGDNAGNFFKWVGHANSDKLNFNYNDLRDYLANTKDKNLLDDAASYIKYPGPPLPLNIPADKIRPHHLYYPAAYLLRQQK